MVDVYSIPVTERPLQVLSPHLALSLIPLSSLLRLNPFRFPSCDYNSVGFCDRGENSKNKS